MYKSSTAVRIMIFMNIFHSQFLQYVRAWHTATTKMLSLFIKLQMEFYEFLVVLAQYFFLFYIIVIHQVVVYVCFFNSGKIFLDLNI